MTEVPEHLLKRSRDRRSALGLGGGDGGDGGDATPAAAAPADEPGPGASVAPAAATAAAKQAAAVPAVAEPAAPVPLYVQNSLKRKKIPLWVMPVLIFIPVWAIIYVGGLSKASSGQPTQLQAGATIFAASCSTCHGSAGGGGVGRPMTDGALIKTFPDILGQLEFVHQGSDKTGPAGTVYGDPNREGGAHATQSFEGGALMPSFGSTLTGAQLLSVVRYEREVLSGATIDPKQVAADGSMLWPDGKPMLDATGALITSDGKPLFDPDGKLTVEPNWTDPVGGTG